MTTSANAVNKPQSFGGAVSRKSESSALYLAIGLHASAAACKP
ncbi:hypothetical protein SynBIOSU31_01322 [Synechococcus sp. BIOS-U3-1]|nr:hypothetical protein SynBIOSU31_01322 [Synechococcus sp. BIOS-U3-1]